MLPLPRLRSLVADLLAFLHERFVRPRMRFHVVRAHIDAQMAVFVEQARIGIASQTRAARPAPRSIMCGCKRQTPTMSAPRSVALALICFVISAGSFTSNRCGFTGP